MAGQDDIMAYANHTVDLDNYANPGLYAASLDR